MKIRLLGRGLVTSTGPAGPLEEKYKPKFYSNQKPSVLHHHLLRVYYKGGVTSSTKRWFRKHGVPRTPTLAKIPPKSQNNQNRAKFKHEKKTAEFRAKSSASRTCSKAEDRKRDQRPVTGKLSSGSTTCRSGETQ